MPEPTLEESIAYLIQQVPAPVQQFVLTKLNDTVLELMATHELHVDQAGVLERELLLMLLGQEKPADFSKALADEGIPAATVSNIIKDVNENVFKRLREEEHAQSERPVAYRTSEPRPEVPVMQVGEVPPSLPGQPVPVPPPAPPAPPTPPPPPPPPAPAFTYEPVPQPQSAAPAESTPIYSTYASSPVTTQLDPRPFMRTMATDMEAASHGMHGTPATPAQSFQTASIPVTYAAPPVYQPAPPPAAPPVYQAPPPVAPTPPPPAPPPMPRPTYSAPVTAPVRLTPIDRAHQNAPLTKEFGTDPYREPIE